MLLVRIAHHRLDLGQRFRSGVSRQHMNANTDSALRCQYGAARRRDAARRIAIAEPAISQSNSGLLGRSRCAADVYTGTFVTFVRQAERGLFDAIKLSLVGNRRLATPEAVQHREKFIGAPVAPIVGFKIAVVSLLGR